MASRDARLKKVATLVARLKEIQGDCKLFNEDFLLTWEKSDAEIEAVYTVAQILEELYKAGVSSHLFAGGLANSIFRDKSTRTRFSFASAASLLGLSLMDLDETKSQVSHGETVRETANMISFATEVIGIRDDLFLGFGHKYMQEVSKAVLEGNKDGVLPHRPTLINLQCDVDHPTQSMADLLHLIKTFGSPEALKGKKIAMTWAYSPSYGKPLSVPQGIIGLMTRMGMEVVLAHPEGYELLPEVLEVAKKNAAKAGGKFTTTHSMEEAFTDADIVYPKSWAPVWVMERRCELLHAGKGSGPEMSELEKKCTEYNAKFKTWECTEDLMKKTKEGKALYMHCLPADITGVSCKEGEVQPSVFDRYRVPLYKEAENKVYTIASMMLTQRFPDPAKTIEAIVKRDQPVRFGM